MQELADIIADHVRQKYATGTGWYAWLFRPGELLAGLSGRAERHDWLAMLDD